MQNHTTMKTILANRVKEGVNDWLSTGKRLIPILFLLLFGVGQMWGVNYNTFSAGDVLFYDFSDVTGNGGTNWHTGKEMMYDASGAGSVKCVIFTSSITMTTDWLIAKTAKGSWAEIKFKNRTNSAHNCIKVNAAGNGYEWTTHTKTVAEYVASGDYIMVYGGELSTWGVNQYKYRFMSANNADNTKGGGHSALSKSINGTSYSFGAALLTSGTYYQGHWNSGLSCAIEAGAAYVVRGTTSLSSDYYSSAKATSGDNSLYQIKKQSSTPTTSLSPTCPSSITEGEKLSFTPGSAGVSVLGISNTIKYYLKSGSTYTEKTLSDGKIDVSDLAEGDYSIITLLYDGYIYVKASTSNFSVVASSTFSVTYNANFPASATTTSGSVPTDATAYDDGATVTVKGNTGSLAAGGYTFAGWNTQPDGQGTDRAPSSTFSISANTPLYAKWTANEYTITLDQQSSATGYGSDGDDEVTATYDAVLPSFTKPTAANGYAFMGFYTEAGGSGLQVIGADGNLVRNVAGYTSNDATPVWTHADDVELYAYYKKAEITEITFDNAVVESNGTVSFAVTVSPTPVGDTKLCFTVLHSNDNPLDDQPAITYNGGTGKYSFTASATSGTYKVQAVLRTGSSCDGGTELDTRTANFQVAGLHTVTVQFKCGDEIIKASETVTGRPLDPTEITAPEIVGYAFSKWKAGDGITIEGADGNGEKASATINFKAIYEGKLTAIYTAKRMIYFYNTLNWENVYVYFYKNDSYWGASNQGTGANTTWILTNTPYGEGLHGQMLPVEEGSKIYYFDAEAAGVNASYTNVVFTELNQHGCDYFYNNNKVVRRGDYHATTMPLFVPLSDQPAVSKNSGAAKYYCEGYWMNYPANTGYTLRIYNTWNADNATGASREFMIPFSSDTKMPLKQDVEINFSGESWFIIYRNDGTYLEGSHTFKQTDHGDKKITSTPNAGSAKKMRLISDGSGIYTFTLTFRGDGGENYDYYLNVDFPAAVGDYRIVYSDNATWSNGAHGAGWYHPSDIIGKNTSETDAKEDTVSFFISHGSSLSMKFQRISAISESAGSYGQITWEDVPSGSITIPTSIEAPGVYNFIVTQPAGGSSISLVKAEPYTGNYYIRTDCAGETKWNNFRSPDHLITYSEYSITHGGYSHYYAHWVQKDDKKNIQFCIANDYSSAISDTLIRENNSDPAWANINNYIDEKGNILRNANVRFMWNQSTNKVSRAYIDGAQGSGSDNYLKLLNNTANKRIKDLSGEMSNEFYFTDNENWIYEANIQAQPNAEYKLISNWGTGITQYFKGTSSSYETLITGTGDTWYVIRVLYDFKTNRIIAAMLPSGEVDNPTPINADVMFIREHQGDINQVILSGSGTITKIETAYGVLRLNKWTMNNKSKEGGHEPLSTPASYYERALYWVSFPFRVKLSEVFGFGTYGTHWILQYYDGAARAANGMWQETGTYWKFVWDRRDFILEPNTGYLLTVEPYEMTEESSVWGPNSRSSQVELYFPSYGKMPDITQADVVHNLPSHQCEIDRTSEGLPGGNDYRTTYDRRIVDSHWNVLSVPTYVNTDDVTFPSNTWTTTTRPKFLYTWNPDDNTITAASASGFTFHAMHAYMVQCYGDVTWSAKSGSPYPIVARSTYSEAPKEVEFCLELQQNEKMIDRTYINLSDDEDVSEGFAFNEDMTKEFSGNKASIYTFIDGDVVAAGNTLPMTEQKTIVPVGIETKTAGDYTIAIPAGTSGIGITLVDEETGVRTNLSALDYTINLPAGKHDNRFYLEISPIKTTPTGLEPTSDSSLKGREVRKVLIDQQMYIIKDGKMYDARGNLCK